MKHFFFFSVLLFFVFTATISSAEVSGHLYERMKAVYNPERFSSFNAKYDYYIDNSKGNSSGTTEQSFDFQYSNGNYIYNVIYKQDDGNYPHKYSWNGKLFVRFGYKEEESGEETKKLFKVGDKDIESASTLNNLFSSMGIISTNEIDFMMDEIEYNEETKVLSVGIKDKVLRKIFFVDVKGLQYSRIEYYDSSGDLQLTKNVKNWKNVDNIMIPADVTWIRPNAPSRRLVLVSFENNVSHINQDFIVTIPYSDQYCVYDLRTNIIFMANQLDKKLMDEKDYLSAMTNKIISISVDAEDMDLVPPVITSDTTSVTDLSESASDVALERNILPEKKTGLLMGKNILGLGVVLVFAFIFFLFLFGVIRKSG